MIEFVFQSGRSSSPNFLFCWPNAVTGMTEPSAVVQSICQVNRRFIMNRRKALLQEIKFNFMFRGI